MRFFFACLAVVLVCLPTDAMAGFHFKPEIYYTDSAASRPGALVVGDVTGDGRADAVIGSPYAVELEGASCTLFMYAQKLNGTLAAPVQLRYRATDDCNNVRMEIADLNNDGIKDIVVGRDYGVTILLARGQLRFSFLEVEDLPGDYLISMTTGDLNEDGNIDLAWQAQDRTLNILLGDGKGGLRWIRSLIGVPSIGTALRIGDVTGDRRPDLILADLPDLIVHPGNGDGSFGQPRTYYAGDCFVSHHNSLAIADTDFDGVNDIVAAVSKEIPCGGLLVYRGDATGGFLAPYLVPTMDPFNGPEGLLSADLDLNGYPDFFVGNGGWGAYSYYLQGPAGLGSLRGSFVIDSSHYRYDATAAGDLTGDGCTDVAFANFTEGMVVLHGEDCYEPPKTAVHHEGDFNGDGRSDLLWHNAATGDSVIWWSGNRATRSTMARLIDKRWFIAGIGDFDGDGRSDVLWRHPGTGANSIWHGGDYRQKQVVSAVTDLRWQVAGTGDFDGDGRSDILWHQKYSGASIVWGSALRARRRILTTITDTAWKIVGIGDFDGNGRADIFWRHATEGRNAIWLDGYRERQPTVAPVADTAWQVAGIGDFDADGRSDIFWRHAFSGYNAMWPAGTWSNRLSVRAVPDTSWKLAAIGDFSNDGRSDVVWRSRRTGANVLWPNGDYLARQQMTTVSSINWQMAR